MTDVAERTLSVQIADASDVPVMQVRLAAWVRRPGVAHVDATRVLTAATELATNIVKYARRGTLRAAWVEANGRSGVELVADDEGPGIPDVALALRDRFSTAGTLGLGLPGVRRLMDDFELRTAPSEGTRVTVRRWLT